jgi:hypothetical protein
MQSCKAHANATAVAGSGIRPGPRYIFRNLLQKAQVRGPPLRDRPGAAAHARLARALLYPMQYWSSGERSMNSQMDSDAEGSDGNSKEHARRRVDAYHEALRERATLRELEQPFVLDGRAWPPPRY